jgi:hypothetical protein
VNGQTRNLLRHILSSSLFALALAVIGIAYMSRPVSASHLMCTYVDEEGNEWLVPCPHFQLTGTGGSGGGTLMPVPWEFRQPIDDSLVRLEQWSINPQRLFGVGTLSEHDIVTVMLVREYPDAGAMLVQPLAMDSEPDTPIMYEIIIGEDNAAADYEVGVLPEDVVGGTYTVLAIPQRVDSPEAFWVALESFTPDMVGVQRFAVENLIALEEDAALLKANGRRIDIPVILDPNLDAEIDVELAWRKDGQPLPKADNPLQPGIYDTTLQTQNQAIIGVYAPWEFLVENLAPQLTAQLGPYFTAGEYKVDVLVDGVLESTQTLTVP